MNDNLLKKYVDLCTSEIIPLELYSKHKVNRGLRDLEGNGVVTGLTNISKIISKKVIHGEEEPAEGELYYRGYEIKSLVNGFIADGRFGFEETVYLLLFGKLPNKSELEEFSALLGEYCTLPANFTRDVIMKAPASDMMNSLARSVLVLYYYDQNPDDISIPNVLTQCLALIARFPLLAIYGYHAYNHFKKDESLFIHQPDPKLSMAENILYILREDHSYTALEANILDIALVLHAEHGGGNNSTFTTRVVSSSGTDTYSAIAAALGSLKGPKHGGANINVKGMIDDLKASVSNWLDEGQVADYLRRTLRKETYDRLGLIYGMGHAVYSLSDPRADVFKSFMEKLAKEKGREDESKLYSLIARIAPEIIAGERRMYKGVSANIDFYSGFVYDMLDLPPEIYTPLFAIARIAGWSAHRIEELVNASKIIRPAYKSVGKDQQYVPIAERN